MRAKRILKPIGIALLILVPLGYIVLLAVGYALGNHEPYIPHTEAESALQSELRQECGCNVGFNHDVEVVEQEDKISAPIATVRIIFQWTKTVEKDPAHDRFNIANDLSCGASDSALTAHATRVAEKLNRVLNHRSVYSGIEVQYSSRFVGNANVAALICDRARSFTMNPDSTISLIAPASDRRQLNL